MRLYKDKYLLAKYDLQDRLIAVGTTPKELGFSNLGNINQALRNANKKGKAKTYTLYAIDCLEKHDDIFAEEDELFLKTLDIEKQSRHKTILDYVREKHVPERTIYSRLRSGKMEYRNGQLYEKEQ